MLKEYQIKIKDSHIKKSLINKYFNECSIEIPYCDNPLFEKEIEKIFNKHYTKIFYESISTKLINKYFSKTIKINTIPDCEFISFDYGIGNSTNIRHYPIPPNEMY